MLEIRKSKCHPNTPIGTDGAHCAPRYGPPARTAGTGTGAPRLRRCAVHRGTGRRSVPPIRVQALRAVPCAGTRCAPVPCVLWILRVTVIIDSQISTQDRTHANKPRNEHTNADTKAHTNEGAHQHRPTNQPTSHTRNSAPTTPPPSLTRSAPELVGRQDPRLRELH
jgi:hypothetical protein